MPGFYAEGFLGRERQPVADCGVARKAKPDRHCLAPRCTVKVLMPDVFCPSHWAILPAELRDGLWDAIKSGDRSSELLLMSQAQTLF